MFGKSKVLEERIKALESSIRSIQNEKRQIEYDKASAMGDLNRALGEKEALERLITSQADQIKSLTKENESLKNLLYGDMMDKKNKETFEEFQTSLLEEDPAVVREIRSAYKDAPEGAL